ncbi:MAG: MotA/TolQ/ExbB proton channel family protein [Bdellovibrionales bacterium CG10_big_fil_rev_8_21_14_0_10_45_34]|nr:MAG: MotA/TolQ/ExbB proton channel family protein [Bdellovibrionales bacterium CG10_big_fil_rev_8_21_14_0_10_45_34]
MFTYISQAFTNGGIWMFAILGVQIVSIAIILERAFYLYLRKQPNQTKTANQFESAIKSARLEEALAGAEKMSASNAIAPVAMAGIQAGLNSGGREEIESRMSEVLNVQSQRLEKRTHFLAMLGNIATLTGLLGTIVGMIQAFSGAAALSAADKSQMLTEGVALAMNTTAYGLIVAIPALVMHSILSSRTQQLQDDLESGATRIFNWLSFNYQPIQTAKVSRFRK